MLKKIFFLGFCFLLVSLSNSQEKPPVWPKEFSQAFSFYYESFHTNGKYWYNYNIPSERFDLIDGRLSCEELAQQKTPCTQITKNHRLYIILPEKKLCCFMEKQEVLPPNWLQQGQYAFVGQEALNNTMYYVWSDSDDPTMGFDLYYADKSPKRIPRRMQYIENVYLDYISNSYSQNPIDSSIFDIPDYCTNKCPNSGLRKENTLLKLSGLAYNSRRKQVFSERNID